MGFIDTLVTKALDGSTERVRVVDCADPIEFEALARAVVILHAPWNALSVKVVREYVKAFRAVPESSLEPVEFYIVNYDKLSLDYLKKLPGRWSGNGETYLVKEGVIACFLDHYSEGFENEFLRCFAKTDECGKQGPAGGADAAAVD